MATLHVFNPDHDYALAVGINVYVSPNKIKKIAKNLEMLPAYGANRDDYILREDNSVVGVGSGRQTELSKIKGEIEAIRPWGWDHSLVMRLGSLGIDSQLLPSRKELIEMRRLSHRRISIDLINHLKVGPVPKECFSLEEASDFLENEKYAFFKAPWSSSGRGIVNSRRMPEENLFAWIRGIINKQGSVLAEKGAEKLQDFASLWECRGVEAVFKGFSMTKADDKGQYLGNICAPQKEMYKYLSDIAVEDPKSYLEEQKEFLDNRVAGDYDGPLGIDMLIDKEGKIRPCIEINLRNTMGHMAMDYMNYIETKRNGNWEPDPYSLFERL